MKTLGQKRSEFALKEVLNLKCDKKDFKTFSAGAPSMILQNGFGQSIAFWISKRTDKHLALLNIIKKWLVDNNFVKPQNDSYAGFIKAISAMEQWDYFDTQKETIALLEWVKRFANADL